MADAEREWVALAKRGDLRAWEHLYRLYQPRLWFDLLRRTKDEALTEDVVQQAFVKAMRSINTFRSDTGLYTWIRQIARNLALDHHRKHSRRRVVSLNQPDGDTTDTVPDPSPILPDRDLDSARIGRAIVQAMQSLTEEQRSVVQLRLVHELPWEQIATQLDIAVGTAKSRHRLGCKKLRELLRTLKEA